MCPSVRIRSVGCNKDSRCRRVFWNAPHHVDGLSVSILCQGQDTRACVIIRIILDNDSLFHTSNDIPDENAICSQFIISVIRHSDLPMLDES